MTDWISVEDRLPDNYSEVLVYTKSEGIRMGYMPDYMKNYKKVTFVVSGHARQSTHWQPLPEPPK